MIKLLIVDDESRTRDGLSSLILQNNFPIKIVGTASNGKEGLELAQSTMPDIILTDVRMPKLDGIEFSTRVKEFHPDCQIIFISGYSDKEYLKSAISLNAVSYVEKPIDNQELLNALSAAIRITEENRQRLNIMKQNQLLHEQQRDVLSEKIAIAFTFPSLDPLYLEKLYSFCPDFTKYSHYRTIICQLDSKYVSEADTPNIYGVIKKTVNHYFHCSLSAQKKANIFILHICYNNTDSAGSIHGTLNQVYSELHAALSGIAEIFLAIGSPVAKPEQLYRSYTNAVICLKKLFFTGYNNICYFKDEDNDIGITFQPNEALFQSFSTALKNDNCMEAMSIATKLFHEMKKTIYKFQTNSIKNVYYQLLVILDTVCTERGITNIFSHESRFIWENIAQNDTIFDLQQYLTDKIALYSDVIASKNGVSQRVYHIQQYIALHFHEPDLSINKMAENLHFTPAYLCQIFKNETGTTINSYINTFRIKKATDLLKLKDIKLYEVSYRVGYNDSNYFSRQFKKHVGMTPSEYRKRNMI